MTKIQLSVFKINIEKTAIDRPTICFKTDLVCQNDFEGNNKKYDEIWKEKMSLLKEVMVIEPLLLKNLRFSIEWDDIIPEIQDEKIIKGLEYIKKKVQAK